MTALIGRKEAQLLADKKTKSKVPIEHLNIAEFNRGQSSKLIRNLATDDKVAFIQKHGKPISVVISNARYERLLKEGIDINEH
jgi:hypothetical protein